MTGEQSERLIQRGLSDEGFLKKLLANPSAAAKKMGIALTAEETAALKKMKAEEFKAFAEEYRSAADPAKRRAAC